MNTNRIQEPTIIDSLEAARSMADTIRGRIRHDVMGRDDVIELMLIALIGGGHILLEDYPGSGKTTLAKALGDAIIDDLPDDEIPDFRRVQFTPDLLAADVTGAMIFDPDSSQFHFRRGPIFAYTVLVDEINRASPKVQSALLEAMAEGQVTVDNVSHPLDELFFVIATQNPLDSVGTYPLPLAQLDRFLFKVRMGHVDRESELAVLDRWGSGTHPATELPRVNRGDVIRARDYVRNNVYVSPRVLECLVDTAVRIREDPQCSLGVSTRSLVQAIPALQVLAMLRDRDFVTPEDIDHLSAPLLGHRIGTIPGADPLEIISEGLAQPLEDLTRSTLRR